MPEPLLPGSAAKIATASQIAARRFFPEVAPPQLKEASTTYEVAPVAVSTVAEVASEIVEPEIVARLVLANGTETPITVDELNRLREAQELHRFVRFEFGDMLRPGETLRKMVRRFATFYDSRSPELQTFYLAKKFSSADSAPWSLHTDRYGGSPKRMTRAVALALAEEHARKHGEHSFLLLQAVPTRTNVEVVAKDVF